MTDKTTFESLEENVIEWGDAKNLIKKDNAIPQLNKTMEEYLETRDAVVKLLTLREVRQKPNPYLEDMIKEAEDEIEDGLGDVLVTLILFAKLSGLDCVGALETAYNVIKNRTGKTVDGIFIKDAGQ
jgi:NTP pyrophosphatase (non-canonical NTP hydrolase)